MNNCYKNAPCILFAAVLLILTGVVSEVRAQNQQTQLDMELVLTESLLNSQLITLQMLNGKGTKLFDLYLENLNQETTAKNLYFRYAVESSKHGIITEAHQIQGKPFSLDPGQQVLATSNTIGSGGLPGVEEYIGFVTDLNTDFLNSLGGSSKLPPDTYRILVEIYQGSNGRNGGVLMASSTAELGIELTEDIRDIYLTSPGDAVGSSVEITNPYPEFRWEGALNATYRLVIVEGRGGESPESLIRSALNTAPFMGTVSSPGTLLNHEIVDAQLGNTRFQFPSYGVKSLEEGQVYYWQVLLELKTSNGIETRNSEIWEFSMANRGSDPRVVDGSAELNRILIQLLGSERYNDIQRNGYSLQSVVIDGQTITGPVALQRLVEFLDQVNAGDVTIVNEN